MRFAPACARRPKSLITFDRPARDVCLAPGVTRKWPTALAVVRLRLDRLRDHCTGPASFDVFHSRLGGLAQLAVAAGRQGKAFLRQNGGAPAALQRRFLLDRARLLVVASGLAAPATSDTAAPRAAPGSPHPLQRSVEHLNKTVRAAGRRAGIETCVLTDGELFADPQPAEAAASNSAPLTRQLNDPHESLPPLDGRYAEIQHIPADAPAAQIAAAIQIAWKDSSLAGITIRSAAARQETLPGLDG
jgi:hypothetical protein